MNLARCLPVGKQGHKRDDKLGLVGYRIDEDHSGLDARDGRERALCWPARTRARADRRFETTRALYSAPITKRKSGPKLIADEGPMK